VQRRQRWEVTQVLVKCNQQIIWHFRFSEQWIFGLQSSGMWHCLVWYRFQHFGGTYCLHPRGRSWKQSKILVPIYHTAQHHKPHDFKLKQITVYITHYTKSYQLKSFMRHLAITPLSVVQEMKTQLQNYKFHQRQILYNTTKDIRTRWKIRSNRIRPKLWHIKKEEDDI
jgi:hypothetical protein